jgi:hypothetical protein
MGSPPPTSRRLCPTESGRKIEDRTRDVPDFGPIAEPRLLAYDQATALADEFGGRPLETLVTGHEGTERRRRLRRIGLGRRAFSDRRAGERRFDLWNSAVADERRCNPDRRKAKRRLEARRKYPNRRVARIPPESWVIEVSPETPLTS